MDETLRARLSTELFGMLVQIVHRTSQDAAAILRREGLNPAQFQLLRAVAAAPGMTQARLGEHRGVTAGGVSQLVSRLAAMGLLRREADGAANRLWLTHGGEALVRRLIPDQDAFFVRRFGALNDADLRRLHELAGYAMTRLPSET